MSSSVHSWILLSFLCQVGAVTFQQSPPHIVKASAEVRINCSHDDLSLPVLLWYQHRQDSLSMTLIGYGYGKTSQQYQSQFEEQFKLLREDSLTGALIISRAEPSHSAVYFCAASRGGLNSEAYFGRGTKLTVLETNQPITPPTVTLLPPSQHECYNQKDKEKKKTLVCVASAFYPDHVSVFWSMNGRNVITGVATDDRALRNGAHYSLTSRLRVPATTWFTPANRFTCTVSFFNGTDSSHHSDGVAGSPGGEETMTREKYLRITQSAKLSYVVLMVKSLIYGAFVVFLVWKPQVQKKALKREDRKDRI